MRTWAALVKTRLDYIRKFSATYAAEIAYHNRHSSAMACLQFVIECTLQLTVLRVILVWLTEGYL